MSPTRVSIYRAGAHGASANVYRTTIGDEPVVRVEWRESDALGGKRRRTETFRGPRRDAERQARAFADGVAVRLSAPVVDTRPRLTVGELWERYLTAHEPDWRPKTAALARARWRVWTLHVPPTAYADLVTPETLDEFRARLLRTPRRHGAPMARNQVAHHLQLVKAVWRWGALRGHLPRNPLEGYPVRQGRDYQPQQVDEFTPAEFAAILPELDRRDARRWRAWAAVALDGLLGARVSALLALRWDLDVDMRARVIRWPAHTDKVGRARVQPLPRDAVFVLRVCRVWARRAGYAGPLVFFGANDRTRADDRPWTYAALNAALHAACDRASVARKPYRALHGLRRMVARNVLDATGGDLNRAGRFIGDVDPRVMARSYLRDRVGDLEPVAAALQLPAAPVPVAGGSGNETETGAE